MSEPQRQSVLVVPGSWDPAQTASQWARRFVRERGARYVEAPPSATLSTVLDLACKEDADFLISGLPCAADSPSAPIDDRLAALMRRAPCPLWTVQPWAGQSPVHFAVAVVGVDPSIEARAAAFAAAAILRRSDSVPRLILVHGLSDHPSQMAATRRWPDILASMSIEHHPWIEHLASELAEPRLRVEAIAQPVWAPDLIGGVARCQKADFIALGSGWRSEAATIRPSSVIRHVVRATPRPVLTVDAA